MQRPARFPGDRSEMAQMLQRVWTAAMAFMLLALVGFFAGWAASGY
jgi:hypothetical protein